jgi:hypothetical protein
MSNYYTPVTDVTLNEALNPLLEFDNQELLSPLPFLALPSIFISGYYDDSVSCPLYFRKLTFGGSVGMSALCQ